MLIVVFDLKIARKIVISEINNFAFFALNLSHDSKVQEPEDDRLVSEVVLHCLVNLGFFGDNISKTLPSYLKFNQ